jgi:hypothetical protein
MNSAIHTRKLTLESPLASGNGKVTTNLRKNTSSAPFFDPIDLARLSDVIASNSVVLMTLHMRIS